MTTINRFKNLDLTLTSNIPLVLQEESKIFNNSNLYLGPKSTNVPGITNLFATPTDLKDSFIASVKARQIGDREGVIENALRIAQAPFSLANAAMQLILYVIQAGAFLKIISSAATSSLPALSASTTSAGIALSFFEGILETRGLWRTARFLKKYYPSKIERLKEAFNLSNSAKRQQNIQKSLNDLLKIDLPVEVKKEIEKELKRNHLTSEEFDSISNNVLQFTKEAYYLRTLQNLSNNYLSLSSNKLAKIENYISTELSHLTTEEKLIRKAHIIETNVEKKKSLLIRRVQHRLTTEIALQVPGLIRDLQSPHAQTRSTATEKAAALFEEIRIQSHKNLHIKAIGLIAVGFTLAGLITGFLACPYLLILALLIIGMLFAIGRGIMDAGFSESKGWEFDTDACIPAFLKSKINPAVIETEPLTPYPRLPVQRNLASGAIHSRPKLDLTLTANWVKA